MREIKNFEASESKEVLESIGSGVYTLITGERGMFLISKTMEDDPDFKIIQDENYRLTPSVMAMSNSFRSFKAIYKNSSIEIIISLYQDDRSRNKTLHPDGGLESSYECILIQH